MLLSHCFSLLTDMNAVIDSSDGTQGSDFKLREDKFRLDSWKKFFTTGMLRHERRLSR